MVQVELTLGERINILSIPEILFGTPVSIQKIETAENFVKKQIADLMDEKPVTKVQRPVARIDPDLI